LFDGYPPAPGPNEQAPRSKNLARVIQDGNQNFDQVLGGSLMPFWFSYFGWAALMILIGVLFLSMFDVPPAHALMTAPDPVPLQSMAAAPAVPNVSG
jgi:hypothetical protein